MSIDHAPRPQRRAILPRAVATSGSALVVACALLAGIATADDTEVYFGQTSPNTDVRSNVLFILDTSGSMKSTDGGDTTRLDRMKVAVKDMLEQADDLNIGLMKFHHSKGGPILFPVTGLDEEVCEGELCDAIVARSSIASDLDDVEEYLGEKTGGGAREAGEVAINGNVLELIHDRNSGEETIGLRFTDLRVPRGAKIVDARLELTAQANGFGSNVHLDVRAEQTGHADTFSAEDKAVTGRDWGIDKTLWTLGNWTRGETYESTDLSRIVGQVTGRADWCGGNALALRLSKNVLSTTGDIRRAMTFHYVTNLSNDQDGRVPTLRVKYEANNLPSTGGCMRTSLAQKVRSGNRDAEQYLDGRNRNMLVNGTILDLPYAGNGSKQEIGVRFDSIRIPKDATIRSAWIEFTSRGVTSGGRAGPSSVRIHGQAANNPPNFGWGKSNITKRPETSASVVWADLPNEPAGTTVRTEDLSPIVSELVGRGGWQSNNSMAFLFTHESGSGSRVYKTYEDDKNAAARLIVEYDDVAASDATGLTARTDTARDRMTSLVDSLVAGGATPLVDTLWEAALYFRGQPVDYGATRGPHNRTYHRVSHPRSYTGGTVYRRSGCTDDNLNASACSDEAINVSPVYISPMENSCQTNHIVLLSDGQANGNDAASRIRALTGVEKCEANRGHEACGLELASWLNERDLAPGIRNRQNVKTHTIAFNLDNPTFLRKLANKGGGSLYTASNSSELLGAFRSIIDGVNSIDTSFTAPGATVNQFNRLTHRSDIYFAMFKPTDRPRWSGNLKKFQIGKRRTGTEGVVVGEVEIRDRNGDPAVDEETGFFSDDAYSFWPEADDDGDALTAPDGHDVRRGGAANQMALDGLARIGSRRTYTWIGDADDVPADGIALTDTAQKLHESNQVITAPILGVGDTGGRWTTRSRRRESDCCGRARGVDVEDEDGDGRIRRHPSPHGRSDALATGHRQLRRYRRPPAGASEEDSVRSIAFVATNEGYLHAIGHEDRRGAVRVHAEGTARQPRHSVREPRGELPPLRSRRTAVGLA